MNIITIPNPNPSAKLQLLCFPFAGGGARTFLNWHKHLPEIELCLIAYPGREHRITEMPITNVDALLEALIDECKDIIRGEFAIFGHSMGSIVSYGLAKKLEEVQQFPKSLFVSAAAAPTRVLKEEKMLSLLSDELFIKIIIERYDEIPEFILQDSRLKKMFVSLLRNDISIEEQYIKKYGSKDCNPLSCDITAFGGIDDMAVSENNLMTWKILTNGTFRKKMFPGTHFYLNEYPMLLLKEISKKCF
jgi:medium-chain acyl-[acyl-carrier-protein] hydrolase